MSVRIQYPRPNSTLWEEEFYTVAEEACRHMGNLEFRPLQYLIGAEYPGPMASVREGATYKSLAYVAHRFGMDADERKCWYNIAAKLSLSQAHIGCIIAALDQSEKLIGDLEEMLRQAA